MWGRKGEGIIRGLANLEMRKWRGVVTESRKKHPSLYIPSCHWLPQREGMWGWENDYEIVNQRQSFLKTLIHTDNFLTFVRFRKL